MRTFNVAIIGLGNAGSRFLSAFEKLKETDRRINIVGICDHNPSRIEKLATPSFTYYEDMLKSIKCNIVVIATTDDTHFTILQHLANNKYAIDTIICEKPICVNPTQLRLLEEIYKDRRFFVTFLERYSPAITTLQDIMETQSWKARELRFTWSKCRIKDSRPTIGILSEITHPIDLCLCLADAYAPELEFECTAFCTKSDFVRDGKATLDSASAFITIRDEILIQGTSSYIAPKRARQIEALLASDDGTIAGIALLTFDDPFWDDDTLTIYEIDYQAGRLKEKFRFDYRSNVHRHQRAPKKLLDFIRDILQISPSGTNWRLPNFKQSCVVQSLINDIEQQALTPSATRNFFKGDLTLASPPDILMRDIETPISHDVTLQEDTCNDWDDRN